jgi:hypothetical protein
MKSVKGLVPSVNPVELPGYEKKIITYFGNPSARTRERLPIFCAKKSNTLSLEMIGLSAYAYFKILPAESQSCHAIRMSIRTKNKKLDGQSEVISVYVVRDINHFFMHQEVRRSANN